MKSKLTISAQGWFGIGLVTCILAAIALFTGQFLCAVTAAFCSAGVAAFDSTHIHLRDYKTWLSYGPIGLFIVCALIWPFAPIWYFVVRVRIARGTMPSRYDFVHNPT